MNVYKSRSGNGGVTAYEYGDDFITCVFKNNKPYTYTVGLNSEAIINEMKFHADNQIGLTTFINQNKPRFKSRH